MLTGTSKIDIIRSILLLHGIYKSNLNSLAAVNHKNKPNADGNSEKVVHL